MPVRLAACDPCRTAKVSCDHAAPCGRCKENDRTADCTYRQRPFKRRRIQPELAHHQAHFAQTPPRTEGSPVTTTNLYPNPGFQGVSSHTSIFDQVKASGGAAYVSPQQETSVLQNTSDDLGDYAGAQYITLLESIRQLDLKASAELVTRWLSQGVDLALAGPLVLPCVDSVCTLFSTRSGIELVELLFRNSRQRLISDGTVPISTFCEISFRNDPGWATLGMFLVALSRAVEDTSFRSVLYSTHTGQQNLQRVALQYADQCLEICLSLDCLNDLQLLLQYENFIAHSMIDGDQSESSHACVKSQLTVFIQAIIRGADLAMS